MPKGKVRYVDFKAVKATVSIVQILSHYGLITTFKPNGKGDSLSGPCPLHGGNNPTQFRVSIEKNCWHCFSECQHGGNILDFVAHKEDCSIREAAILISDWFDVTSPEPPVLGASPRDQERSPANASNKEAAADSKVEEGEDTAPSPGPVQPNKPLGF
jgi:DNA primase